MAETPPAAVHVPHESPKVEHWDDEDRGKVSFRTIIDGAAGPSRSIVQGIAYLEPGHQEGHHRHDRPQTAYVLKGGGEVKIGDETMALGQGDAVFIPEGLPHSWRAGDDGLDFLYTFAADRFDDVTYDFDPA